MPTYALIGNVKERLNLISGAWSDNRISGAIEMAEGMIDGVMQKTGIGASPDYTFDSTKHGLIRNTCTSLAAFMMLSGWVEEFSTSSTVSLTADLLWAEADRGLAILSVPRVNKFVRGV